VGLKPCFDANAPTLIRVKTIVSMLAVRTLKIDALWCDSHQLLVKSTLSSLLI